MGRPATLGILHLASKSSSCTHCTFYRAMRNGITPARLFFTAISSMKKAAKNSCELWSASKTKIPTVITESRAFHKSATKNSNESATTDQIINIQKKLLLPLHNKNPQCPHLRHQLTIAAQARKTTASTTRNLPSAPLLHPPLLPKPNLIPELTP